jgi:hypothetical protein
MKALDHCDGFGNSERIEAPREHSVFPCHMRRDGGCECKGLPTADTGKPCLWYAAVVCCRCVGEGVCLLLPRPGSPPIGSSNPDTWQEDEEGPHSSLGRHGEPLAP